MTKQKTNTVSIEDAVYQIGRQKHQNFALLGTARREVYEKVYYSIAGNKVLKPFSATSNRNSRISELSIDPDKGALLIGSKGVGKKVLFEVMETLFEKSKAKFDTFYLGPPIITEILYHSVDVFKEYGRGSQRDLLINQIRLEELYEDAVETLRRIVFERAELYKQKGYKTHLNILMEDSKFNPISQTRSSIINIFGREFYNLIMQMNNEIIWEGFNLRRLNIHNSMHGEIEGFIKSL